MASRVNFATVEIRPDPSHLALLDQDQSDAIHAISDPGLWFRGLLSIAIIAGSLYLLKLWYDDSQYVEITNPPVAAVALDPIRPEIKARQPQDPTVVKAVGRKVFRFDPGWNRATAYLAGGVTLLLLATVGRWLSQSFFRLTLRSGTKDPRSSKAAQSQAASMPRESKKVRRAKALKEKQNRATRSPVIAEGDEDPQAERTGDVHLIHRPDGSVIRVECYGPADAPPIIMTHGWGANSTEWFYQKRYLTDRFRLILWDEPGLGLSKKPDNNDYRMENLAADLDAVLTFAGKPAVLLGHSIGGMITLMFCKIFPEALGTRVAGLVLAHTSYTNPVRTTKMATLYTALEKPVLIPMMHLTIALWPLAWLMNLLSYANGSAHRSTHKTSFSGNETKGQLNFVAKFLPHARPDVLARGMLGMIRYDATDILTKINVPTLVVIGDQDTTTLPEAGQFIHRQVPRAQIATLAPAKHMGLIEHHGRFDQLVAGFADSCMTAKVAR